jgi:hypothetical protein
LKLVVHFVKKAGVKRHFEQSARKNPSRPGLHFAQRIRRPHFSGETRAALRALDIIYLGLATLHDLGGIAIPRAL